MHLLFALQRFSLGLSSHGVKEDVKVHHCIAVKRLSLLPQVREFGCSSFSLLFDDIEAEMCPADKQAYCSFAHAQVDITNAVYRHLGEPATFLFCPTGESRLPCEESPD